MLASLKQHFGKLLISTCLVTTPYTASAFLIVDNLGSALGSSAVAGVTLIVLSPVVLIPSGVVISAGQINASNADPYHLPAEAFLENETTVQLTQVIPIENGYRYVLQRSSDQQLAMFDITDPNAPMGLAELPVDTILNVDSASYGIILSVQENVLALFPNETGKKLINQS